MYFLIFLTVLTIVYVHSFKEDFKEEHIAKVTPVLIIIVAIVLILNILVGILKH